MTQTPDLVGQSALAGAAIAGGIGGVFGLVIGLQTYAPTAWAAVFELGLPAATLGLVVGFVVGLFRKAGRS